MAREASRALITDQSGTRLLLARRAEGDYRGGTWSAFGGKIDTGESPEQAVMRETFEEAGLILGGLVLFKILDNSEWTTHFYSAEASGEMVLNTSEHTEAGYFSSEELTGLELAFDHLQVYSDFLASR